MPSLDTAPPSPNVLAAFGIADTPRRLYSARGSTWRAGDVVLKHTELNSDWLAWEGRVLESLSDGPGFRIQRLRRTWHGAFSIDGWIARDYLEGAHKPGRWLEIIGTGNAFHRATSALHASVVQPVPAPRKDAWALADRFAWGDVDLLDRLITDDDALQELIAVRRPVQADAQVIHGDLTGNVVFANGLAPGIIDFSPYWRPAAYAIGVVVADAVTWEGADLSLLSVVQDLPDMGQCLVRALIFRHVTALLLPGRLPIGEDARRYRALRTAALKMATP